MTSAITRRCRVFVVDNNSDLAESLAMVIGLEPDLECVGVSSSGADALARATAAGTDVMILDLSIPGRSALSILDDSRANAVQVGIIIYTGHAAPELASAARARGALGYVVKGGPFEDLAAEIRRVYAQRPPGGS